ncbi:MAG TPA: carbohydrate kinase family protein [Isosphaeraceae bacterium]|nr:carbohydrate kinase family protein [Isosphaeraceae bacterium]
MSPSTTIPKATAPVVCAGLVVADHVCPPLDHLPRPGELIAVEKLVLNIGGGAANTAVDLARLGVTAAICARVGDDAFGRFATETLRGHGVDCTRLALDPNRATSQTLIVNVRGEDRRFIHSVGANAGFVAADLDGLLDRAPRVLHIGYFLILPQLTAHELAERFQRARSAGTITLLDVATPGPGAYLDRLKVVLPQTDLFVPNTDEAELILGETDPVRQARIFHDLGARRVVVTCGEGGVVSVSESLQVKLAAYSVPYVDGSGGGDAFNAGYIVGLLEGRPEIECLKLASAVGASCVRAVGTTEGVFTRAEAEQFVASHELAIEPIR